MQNSLAGRDCSHGQDLVAAEHNTTAEYIALFTATYPYLEAINLQEHNVLQRSSLLSRSTHIYSFPPS
jgi:hypothetical protein